MDIDDILADARREPTPQAALDLQELTRAWVAERVAPEVLAYPQALMDRVLGRIRQQIELVEEQTGSMDPKTNFSLIIVQTELERFKFLVRSLLRARMAKLDAHPLHHLTDSSAMANLSSSEHAYLTSHHALLGEHYNTSFLAQFPPALRRLDDTAGGISMIDAPDTDTAVFVRALRDVGLVSVPGTDVAFEMERGDVFVVRWSVIKGWVTIGDVELV